MSLPKQFDAQHTHHRVQSALVLRSCCIPRALPPADIHRCISSVRMGRTKRKGGGGGGGGGSGSSGKMYCGESAAAVGTSISVNNEAWTRPPSRSKEVQRPTAAVESALADQIADALVERKIRIGSSNLNEPVPTVDMLGVVQQMASERDRFFAAVAKGGSIESRFHELGRYGGFLQKVRDRIQEEHKKATQKAKVAKALADRARGEREWSTRSMALERANALVHKLTDAATNHLNKHVAELQQTPDFIRAMAETQARDRVQPGWDCSWLQSGTFDDGTPIIDDGLAPVEEGISFEDLLAKELKL